MGPQIYCKSVFSIRFFGIVICLLILPAISQTAGGAGAMAEERGSGIVAPAKVVLPGEEFYRQGVDFKIAGDLANAIKAYEQAVALEHPRAAYNLGLIFLNEEGVKGNKNRGLELLKLAGKHNHARAQCNLGVLYEEGQTIPKNEVKARRWYARSAAQDFQRAKVRLAMMLEEGRGGTIESRAADLAEAIKIYQAEIDIREKEIAETREESKRKEMQELLNLSRSQLARLYLLGEGVAKDEDRALALFRTAASQRYGLAYFNLGMLFEDREEFKQAREYYDEAVKNGYEKSYYFLGKLLEDRLDGEKDERMALECYRKAARIDSGVGYSPIQYAAKEGRLNALKVMVEAGGDLEGVNKDDMTALKLAIKYGHQKIIDWIQERTERRAEGKLKERLAIQAERMAKLKADVRAQAERIAALNGELAALSPSHTAQITSLREQLTSFIQEQEQQKLEHQKLMQQYHEAEEINAKRDYIKVRESLRVFYRQFQLRLEEFLLAYKVLNTGLLVRADDTTNKIATGISLAGDMVPFPGVAFVTKGISFAINFFHNREEKRKISNVSNLLDITSEMDRELEAVARILTLMYEPQLILLTEEGSKLLAERGVRRIIEYLRAGKGNDKETLSDQILRAIATEKSTPGAFAFLDKELKTNVKTLAPWTDTGVFQLSGIETEETKEGKKYVGHETLANIYRYRKASRALVEKLGFREVPDLSAISIEIRKLDGSTEVATSFEQLFNYGHTIEALTRSYHSGIRTPGSASTGAGGGGTGYISAPPPTAAGGAGARSAPPSSPGGVSPSPAAGIASTVTGAATVAPTVQMNPLVPPTAPSTETKAEDPRKDNNISTANPSAPPAIPPLPLKPTGKEFPGGSSASIPGGVTPTGGSTNTSSKCCAVM